MRPNLLLDLLACLSMHDTSDDDGTGRESDDDDQWDDDDGMWE
jgi:hypothetical protein